ncbi:polysaccharide deacetylase family protein [Pseudomonas typographi]|uniref:polysaccharide deacetylase family protein n=1 Tax=Pseudomonas typographi TaxID=2715964 RepID=UPI0016890D9E|nr:polysaccharide deacetylase family protein [Pseudomonas typographi]MBD1550528.1 polysaccharide deacetylase family protein [Pseudomonas typographi]
MLPGPNRFAYSGIESRADFQWPEGKRLAFYVALCVEHFSYGSGGLGLSYSPGISQPNTYNWAWREYGNRVGGWRILALCKELGIPLTVLLNTECYEHCPELVQALVDAGAEIVAHGRSNSEIQNGLSEEQERQLIHSATESIKQHSGLQPAGWMSPGANPSAVTEDLLQEAGYLYTLDWPMDDQPVWMKTREGKLLSLPYPHEVNDVPMVVLHHGTAPAFAEMAIANFDEMLVQSSQQSLVYGMTLHTFIMGQPFRLQALRKLLEHIKRRDDAVWFTTAGQIAKHYAQQIAPDLNDSPQGAPA